MRILLIDDNENFRRAIVRKLEREGWEVELAFTGEAGLRAVMVRAPDVVLLDLNLGPGISGQEVAVRLPHDLPIFILTGSSRKEARDLADRYTRALGAAQLFFEKSDDLDKTLMVALRRLALAKSATIPAPPSLDDPSLDDVDDHAAPKKTS